MKEQFRLIQIRFWVLENEPRSLRKNEDRARASRGNRMKITWRSNDYTLKWKPLLQHLLEYIVDFEWPCVFKRLQNVASIKKFEYFACNLLVFLFFFSFNLCFNYIPRIPLSCWFGYFRFVWLSVKRQVNVILRQRRNSLVYPTDVAAVF